MKGTRLKIPEIKNVRKCVANYILEELFLPILKHTKKIRVIRRPYLNFCSREPIKM